MSTDETGKKNFKLETNFKNVKITAFTVKAFNS